MSFFMSCVYMFFCVYFLFFLLCCFFFFYYIFLFFFFKQKTAYEMRISDWSSDVCSSDLRTSLLTSRSRSMSTASMPDAAARRRRPSSISNVSRCCAVRRGHCSARTPRRVRSAWCRRGRPRRPKAPSPRSEEHTSELQSLMRTSYAVFCWQHKNISLYPFPYRVHTLQSLPLDPLLHTLHSNLSLPY